MKANKISKAVRLPQALIDLIEKEAKNTGKSRNAIIEEAIYRYFNQPAEMKMMADLFIDLFDKKYGNALTRIRLAANTADKNVQALLHVKNTELFSSKVASENFISTNEMQHGILENAHKEVKRQIALYKQRKDNSPASEEK